MTARRKTVRRPVAHAKGKAKKDLGAVARAQLKAWQASVGRDVRKRAGEFVLVLARVAKNDVHSIELKPAPDLSASSIAHAAAGGELGSLSWRFTMTDGADIALRGEPKTPDRGAYWFDEIITLGADAVLETADDFARVERVADLEGNVLVEISDRLTTAIRRRILHVTLLATKWNLTHTAARLHMADASAVRKEIDRLGLTADYDAAADKRGAGGRRTREPDRK